MKLSKLKKPAASPVVEEAAYAVFDRRGGEDLTQAEFHEEVLGLLRNSSTAMEKQIDRLYKHIYGDSRGRSDKAVKKKSPAQLDREIASALTGPAPTADNDAGVFYLTDIRESPLGPEFGSRAAAKRAAMKLVRESTHPRVEVWHRWRGDRYMQGLASKEGWSDV